MLKSSVVLPDERLYKYGYNVAKNLQAEGFSRIKCVVSACAKNLAAIAKIVETLTLSLGDKRPPAAVEWLCDNHYLIEREGRQTIRAIEAHLRVPSSSEEGKTLPNVYIFCQRFLEASGGDISLKRLLRYFEAVQDVIPLTEEELSLIPAMLRFSLIGILRDAAEQIIGAFRKGDQSIEGLAGEAAALIGSLRQMSAFDAEGLKELSVVERYLSSDPAGIYQDMDEKTRESYRAKVARLAKKQRLSEAETAKQAIRLASQGRGEKAHVGWWLFAEPLGKRGVHSGGRDYVTGLVLGVFAATAGFSALLGSMWYIPLILLPVYEIVKTICDLIALKSVPPSHIPRMAISGIPPEGRTLVAMSALLTNPSKPRKLASLLEEYLIVNRLAGENLSFAILADLKDGKDEHAESDEAILSSAIEETNGLNSKYGLRFFLLIRPRTLNKRDKLWMGRERKRGAIADLVKLLSGRQSGLYSACGDKLPMDIRYVIALDEDTRLSAGTAAALAGAMLHPLNRAWVDPKKRVVTRGYGILQPRIALDLESSNRSAFSKLMGGLGGVDPYGSAMSDVYQDLFGRGIFTGKGIIDVRAFDACIDGAIPDNTVLSHDLLEGAYLRAGLIGDVEFSDGFPSSVLPYFSRLHRWVRGDTQVLPWLGLRVKNEEGKQIENPLPAVAKLWIFDNLRRLLTPFFTLLCLLFGLGSPGLSAIALASISAGLVISGIGVTRSGAGFSYRFSDRFNETWTDILRALVLLAFLPYNAWVCLSGFFTALWRMKITRRKMLEWVPAADLKDSSTLDKTAAKMALGVVLGIACVFPYRNVWAEILGFLWVLSPAFALLLSKPRAAKRGIGENVSKALCADAAEMFSFFKDLMNAENNFLPPDNLQIMPDLGVAPRTSPTNIGLALVCVAAAAELGIMGKNEAISLISRSVSSIERMEKWRGNLLNWYDTTTLEPLLPKMVSSVDSGNFYACLLALKNALRAFDGADGLIKRLESILLATELGRMFDDKKKQFYISLDPVTEKPGDARYDLLASESRILSFVAIAKGMAPLKHWGRLGRLLTTDGRGVGLASWTGSMFEYLMPSIFLPDYEGSLIRETLRFAIKCQKDRVAKKYIPWGISESAFYAFDSALNYQYKAHGVQCLGLKRGLNSELVISPYSSYLALLTEPQAAFENIKVLKNYPISGKYGLYEAIDMTPSRVGEGKRAVACYMAHHLGMSFLSIASVIGEGMVQRWLMEDKNCFSYRTLLQERLPVGAVVFRNCRREVPEKRQRNNASGFYQHNLGFDNLEPRAQLMSNGSYNLLVTDSGHSRAYCQGVKLYNFSERAERDCRGLRMAAAQGREAFELIPGEGADASSFRSEFYGSGAAMIWRRGGLSGDVRIFVPEGEKCEVRRVRVVNDTDEAKRLKIGIYVEPVLSGKADFEAHPMFSRLFLTAKKQERCATVTRQGRQGRSLSLALACDRDCGFTLSRNALGRGGGAGFADFLARGIAGGEREQDPLDPCLICVTELEILPHEAAFACFAIGFGEGTRAAEAALRGLSAKAGSDYVPLLTSRLGLDSRQLERAMEEASEVLFGRQKGLLSSAAAITGEGQSLLWKFGISGDFPLMTILSGNEEKGMLAERFRRFVLLREAGFLFDLAVVIDDAGDYTRKGMRLTASAAAEAGAERYISVRAGLHIIDSANFSEGDIAGLKLFSGLVKNGETERQRETAILPAGRRATAGAPLEPLEEGLLVSEGALPPIVHSIPLANRHFGYIACDSGSGHIWRINSRQNKLSSWTNDPLALSGAERLECEGTSGVFSLFMGKDMLPQRFSFDNGAACWERSAEGIRSKLTAFIHPYEAARIMLLELECDEEVKIRWSVFPQMGEKAGMLPMFTGLAQNSRAVFAKTTAGDYSPQALALCSSLAVSGFTCLKSSFLRGEYDSSFGWGYEPVLACEYVLRPVNGRAWAVLVAAGCDSERGIERISDKLCDVQTAKRLLAEVKASTKEAIGVLTLDSGKKAVDNYVSGMALYQTIYCRLFSRASYSQCGGGYGFRDQLQDCLGAIYSDPKLMKYQIIRAACRQYIEGDVQHWWHPSRGGKPVWGVRTRYSDDLLWLPFALCDYIEKTGDTSLLGQRAPYISSQPLNEREEERFENAGRSLVFEDIYNHCLRAIELAIARGRGAHGLPLILGGDWNDGFNRVGAKGKGESLWLAWFFSIVLDSFAPLCELRGDALRAEGYRKRAKELASACDYLFEKYYPRAYFDDGTKMGANGSGCEIDSIAQSFAVFNPYSEKKKAARALNQALERLVDKNSRIIKLLAPPFGYDAQPDPGYIRCYPPGIRENGGQYTHAAIWLVRASLEALGMGIKPVIQGLELMDMLMPEGHGENYAAERFVLAGDVYDHPNAGRGGWSWYTGAAGWYFKTAAESLCGIEMRAGRIVQKRRINYPGVGFGLKIGAKSFVSPKGNQEIEEAGEKDNETAR